MSEHGNGCVPVAESPLALASRLGATVCLALEDGYRSARGQFLSPPPVARLLAGMFARVDGDVRLVDLGAGVGTLTAACVEEALRRKRKPHSLQLTVWETEPGFIGRLRQVLEACVDAGNAAGVPTTFVLNHGDLLKGERTLLEEEDLFVQRGNRRGFTHVIMNPPYRKINADSEARRLLRRAGLETSNLYTGFLWLAAKLLEPEGQLVAITPRSFCNGPYFLPFRKQFFELMALERVHVFDRRDTLFSGDDVLQENVIMCARRTRQRSVSVVLTQCSGLPGGKDRSRTVAYSRVLDPADPSRVVHLAIESADDRFREAVLGMPASLRDLGVEVSTGRVVEFRARGHLRDEPERQTAPLIYPLHFNGGGVHWPCPNSRKPNALLSVPETDELLVPNGVYVLVKRFTAKEERKRIVATVFRPEGRLAQFPSVGFENHLNYFHQMGRALEPKLADGLAAYLNSTVVDSYFRQFSGHTQVNATDLRNLRYPSTAQLTRLAECLHGKSVDQTAIDAAVGGMIERSRP